MTAARAPLAGPLVMPWTPAGPGGEPGRRPHVVHRRADLGQDRPGRGRLDAGAPGARLHLRCPGRHALAERPIQVGQLPVEPSDAR
jgi:hypothetical protein